MPELSRAKEQRIRKKQSQLLNWLIGIVLLLIAGTLFIIFSDDSTKELPTKREIVNSPESQESPKEEIPLKEGLPEEQEESATDSFVERTYVKKDWQPYPTEQIGEHISSYDGKSIDWQEKKEAIAYAVNQPLEQLIYWKVKNGGSSDTSIGIISTIDKEKKYRVFLEWQDGEGWLPVRVDELKTLDFEF